MVVVVTPSRVIETSLTTVFDDEPLLPPDALLPEDDDAEEVDDVASVCELADVEDVDWVEAVEVSGDAVVCDVTEEIDMVMPA